jgi:hypothetical protein
MLLTLLLVLAATVPSPPTADAILDRYAAARGGIEKIRAIRTVIFRGEYHEGDHVSPNAAMSLMRPYYKLVGDAERPVRDFAEGYDGSAWEYYGDPGLVVRTVGAASEAGRHAVYIDGLLGYRERGWRVDVAGEEQIGERKAWRLAVTMRDGIGYDAFFDAESGLLIAQRKAAPIHAFGTKVTSEERIGDYRDVDGALFPFEHKEVEIATGRVLNEMHWKSITLNHDLDRAVFSPPEWKRTPVQELLAQIFAERTDANAVMWTYSDFRRANPDAETDAAIQAVGYQMLKMGSVQPAIVLLEQNAADNPRSATAAFGLGRALATGGGCERAAGEFRRAISLNPGYKRAEEALQKLTCH